MSSFFAKSPTQFRETSGNRKLDDANKCIELGAPGWGKGYYRLGMANVRLGKIRDAIAALTTGVGLDPTNQELENALEEANDDLKELEKSERNENTL